MTRKLYYDDTWMDACQATVLECRQTEDGYAVLLDQTVLFPEGGGQPSDTGRIDNEPVLAAYEEGEEIWNRTAGPLQSGKAVCVRTDMERRRDHSQQHTGEHIISGLASKLFNAHNVGFHMAETYSTLDLDAPLSDGQMQELEREANRVVQRNAAITYRFVHAEDLDALPPLRKRAKGLTGEVRIVYVEDTDSCTCCGTHCKSAGEVGYIRFTAWQKYKGGVRLWFACGMRAVMAAMAQRDAAASLAKRFSTSEEEVTAAVLRQGDELTQARHTLKKRTEALLGYEAADMLTQAEEASGVRLVVARKDELGMPELKLLSEKLTKAQKCVALLFTAGDGALGYQLAASAGVPLSMREVCSAVNAATGGRGGGREDSAQGSAKTAAGLKETMEQLTAYLRAALGASGKK